MKKLLKKILLGRTLNYEYICLKHSNFKHKLRVIISFQEQYFDITEQHLFLGYKPLIFGIVTKTNDQLHQLLEKTNQNTITFEVVRHNKVIRPAKLIMNKNTFKPLDVYTVWLLIGHQGYHSFKNPIQSFFANLQEKIKKRKPGNIDLPGNLHDQVRIAYSVPRNISLITTYYNGKMNLFPTDLHGPLGTNYYAGSLRIGGKAEAQVRNYQKVVISRISSACCQKAYSLGKNHMKELSDLEDFDLTDLKSKRFNYPLPENIMSYLELQMVSWIDINIHRIFIYEILNTEVCKTGDHLTHIHADYADWRLKKGLDLEISDRKDF